MKKYLFLFTFILDTLTVIAQNHYSVIIDEIMADPSPTVALPAYEWIEIKNISGAPLNLQNWRIADASGQSGPIPSFILQPDSFLVICPAAAISPLSFFGAAVSVSSFPSLDNDGEQLFLKAPNGSTIHAVNYSSFWYGNELKKEGGWTLEMIDTQNPCSGSNNWKASIHPNGGTPGQKNSVDAINRDTIAPHLINAYAVNNTTIVIVYDEPIDSLSGSIVSNYLISDGTIILQATALAPLFDHVQLTLSTVLTPDTIYTVTASNVSDCKGNVIVAGEEIKTGLPADPHTNEILVNEILFNPRSNAFDYVEFYNNSHNIIDAGKLSVANRNTNGAISSIKPLSTVPHYIFPGDYIVITENPDNLALNYLVKYPEAVLTIPSLPSFPDQQGDVILLNSQGEILDEVPYNENWHFKLLNNPEGVSLERIDPSGTSNDPANWHSAASTAGYGTPGYKNSQFKDQHEIAASITVTPTIFSPDNDGRDDVATIQYRLEAPGYVATVMIFDASGRIVKMLARNAILGNTGYWNWDGLNDKNQSLPIGTYIIIAEIFNLQGKKHQFKNTVVLARQLK